MEHDFFCIKDDAPKMYDPTGTGLLGRSVGQMNLTQSALAKPVILLKSRATGEKLFMTCELYAAMGGEELMIHIVCPLCALAKGPNDNSSLSIKQSQKAFYYDPNTEPRFDGFNKQEIMRNLNLSTIGGTLSVEPFKCTWEDAPDMRRGFGFSVCGWNTAIEKNVAYF